MGLARREREVKAQSLANFERDIASARQCVIEIPIVILPQLKVVSWITRLGAFGSVVMDSLVERRRVDDGSWEPFHAF
mgnify:CR=1 FL=1